MGFKVFLTDGKDDRLPVCFMRVIFKNYYTRSGSFHFQNLNQV